MTEQQFKKTAFKANMLINYHSPRLKPGDEPMLCILCEVDFDEEMLTIEPLENPRGFENKHQVNIKHCTVYDKKIRKIFNQ